MNLYVSGLNFKLTSDELRTLFEQYGEVTSAKVITDKFTGKSRGFGFVEMPEDGQKAMSELNGAEIMGKTIAVSEARPQTERKPFNNNNRGGGGGNYGGGGGGGRRW